MESFFWVWVSARKLDWAEISPVVAFHERIWSMPNPGRTVIYKVGHI